MRLNRTHIGLALAAIVACCSSPSSTGKDGSVELLNVSYDPTRELYKAVNTAFAAKWKQDTGQTVRLTASPTGGRA